MDERKFLVPKEKEKKRKDSFQEIEVLKPNRHQTNPGHISPSQELEMKYNDLKPKVESLTEEEIMVRLCLLSIGYE